MDLRASFLNADTTSKDIPRSASGDSARTGVRVVSNDSEVQRELQGKADERDRAIEDVWARILSQIPTTFGRVAYVAGLRNEDTGAYHHFELALRYADEEADRFLCASHKQIFGEWLTFPLEQQLRDLKEYLESTEEREVVLETWLRLKPYRNLIPFGARDAERLLFISDLEVIFLMLLHELSACDDGNIMA